MIPPDKPKGATSRRIKKAPVPGPEPRIAGKAEARNPAEKQASDQQSELLALARQAANLKFKVGGLEEQLRKAREGLGQSEARVAELERRSLEQSSKAPRVLPLEQEIAAIRPQLEEARRRLKETQADLKKAREERDRTKGDLAKAEARAVEQEHRARELSTQASRVAALEQEASELRPRLEETRQRFKEAQAELKNAREALGRAESENAQLRVQATERKSLIDRSDEQRNRAAEAAKSLQEARDLVEAENVQLRAREVDLKREIERAEARTAEAKRYFESLERELIDERNAKAKERGEASPPSEMKLPSPQEAIPIESTGPLREVVAPSPEPQVPATVASTLPRVEAIPGPALRAETVLKSQNFFGPDGDDGQPVYVLSDVLSKDVLGVVYRCSERATGRAFMARFMAGQAGEEQTQAIERGVEKLISLPHPNILHVQGSGRRKNRLYLMMDLVEAPTLGQAKIQEIPRICAILRDAAAALHYAHEEGIFHGDVNPESILVAKEDGRDHALLREFGLGFLQEIMLPPSSDKEVPPFIRDPAYLPPEQVRVLKSPLGPAGDVYGLGATLYSALARRPPFEGKDAAQVAKRVMIEEPMPVGKIRPDVPEAVGAVVRRAMAKERGLRYGSAQEMADALTRFLDGAKS